MKKHIVTTLMLLMFFSVNAQKTINCKVVDQNNKPLSGFTVVVNLKDTLTSNESGTFQYLSINNTSDSYKSLNTDFVLDTLIIINSESVELRFTSTQKISGAGIKASKPAQIGTDKIDQVELKKSACCDLAGCFETQGSVQPMTTNVITNSKELRILGLSGVYNQVLTDGIPIIHGLGYTYGISAIPGTLVDNIYVSKGTTSVLQGYESMVGQINVITKPSDKNEKLLVNAYINSFGESQYNVNYRMVKKNVSNLITLHSVLPAAKWDRDKDKFLDLPMLNRYLLFDKLKIGNENQKGFNGTIHFRTVWEERNGGQKTFNPKTDKGSSTIYGQAIHYTQSEAYSKLNYRYNSVKKISLYASGFTHNQNSWFGTVNYRAKQKSYYGNLQYENTWNQSHEIKVGSSIRHLNTNEQIAFSDTFLHRTYNGNYLKNETIPGLFAENTFKWKGDIITLITGFRADHHNKFGWQYTPRASLKYELSETSTIRASIGKGWRTVNLFSENVGLLVSSRNILFDETLRPEVSYNWGLNFLKRYTYKKLEGNMIIEFYQTRFKNQFFPDYDADPNLIRIYNFTQTSVSNGLQAEFSLKYNKRYDVKMVYNYLDVYRMQQQTKVVLPFNSKHKLLLSMSYTSKNKKFRFDMNSHWFGKQRLPDTDKNPEEYQQPKQSKSYFTHNIQCTYVWKKFEWYVGCENVFDYRQLKPIVSWQNPFSPYFDTSFNWGPTRGREAYLGFRYKL